ncbi:hypothetical protein ACUM5Y_05375 [Marinomonas dokdonensis]|uniref:hypothetical protein n=1 Tax=Marinomonas dokdonensis TaxID=328224 RepID=UPI0040555438
MLSYRLGLLLLTLLLGACSTSPLHQSTNQADQSTSDSLTENTQTDGGDTELALPTTETDHEHTTPSQINPDNLITSPTLLVDKKLISEMNTEHQLALENYQTLLHVMGPEKAPELPRSLTTEQLTDNLVKQKTLELQAYNQQAEATLASQAERAKQRKSSVMKGDHVQIFFSEISIQHPDNGFNAQPLVGQWVRGEQRSIRLNNNFLIEPPLSETLSVTFSEDYQVLLNGQLIVSINPNQEKNDASFTIKTADQQGQVTGKLGYRIITP